MLAGRLPDTEWCLPWSGYANVTGDAGPDAVPCGDDCAEEDDICIVLNID